VWAVAVEGKYASLIFFGEMREHRSEACGKAVTFLRNYSHFVACQPRQLAYVRVRAHDGNFHIVQ
jgi:hypothetical protein